MGVLSLSGGRGRVVGLMVPTTRHRDWLMTSRLPLGAPYEQASEGPRCLEEGCLGLPGRFPDITELRFSLGNEGKDGKNLNSQTWPGTPRRPAPRHPRPPEGGPGLLFSDQAF